MSITDHFGKVRSLPDVLAATGNPLPNKEFITYILASLGLAYESFITLLIIRSDPLTSHELYQLLLIHENRISHFSEIALEPSVNYSVEVEISVGELSFVAVDKVGAGDVLIGVMVATHLLPQDIFTII